MDAWHHQDLINRRFIASRVAGHLDLDWSDYLHGMAIANHSETEAKVATVTGGLPDQAALLGVLNALFDGHVTVLAVERLTTDWERVDPAPEQVELPPTWLSSNLLSLS